MGVDARNVRIRTILGIRAPSHPEPRPATRSRSRWASRPLALHDVRIPSLVVVRDHDFIPLDVARHIAGAMPEATLVTIEGCGHFAYLECGEAVRRAVDDFLGKRRLEPLIE